MTTYHCSEKAFSRCPNKQFCGSQEEAEFAEGSECAEFNRKQVKMGGLVPDRQVVSHWMPLPDLPKGREEK